MHKSIGSIIVTIAVLLPVGAGRAADKATCDAYVNEAVSKAQGVRQFECGFQLDDPRWGTDRDGHARWCKDASKDDVAREQARRRGEIKLCQTCRGYADAAATSAANSIKFACGFEGPRWNAKAEDHFGWCMQQRETIGAEEKNVAAAYKASLQKMQQPVDLEAGIRVREAMACKARQANARKSEPNKVTAPEKRQ
ncbi:MAG TPA: hypothetical protein VJL90_13930 [Pseudorhodoplanes sp.]|nr:hypothetical protein [Pseudorhodoplanes sp.]